MLTRVLLASAALIATACNVQRITTDGSTPATPVAEDHSGHHMPQGSAAPRMMGQGTQGQSAGVPAGAADVAERLARSPRHAEWAKVAASPGSSDSIAAWVVFPERPDNAPVVIVIHEIFGLSGWVRGVADQLAADGFIAIAPDLLSIERGGATPDSMAWADARNMIGRVTPDKMNAMVAAVARYGMSLPAAAKSYGVVGYCWGGTASFNHAVFGAPGLKAAVVYYGSSPVAEEIAKVRIPVLGLYAENDQRVNATIARADSTMRAIGGNFVQKTYAGAGHGFLRAQDQPANAEASRQAWPETVAWFRRYLN